MSTTTDTLQRVVIGGSNIALAAGAAVWPVLLARYSAELVLELADILSKNGDPTAQEIRDLLIRYGTRTPDQALAESAERLGIITTS